MIKLWMNMNLVYSKEYYGTHVLLLFINCGSLLYWWSIPSEIRIYFKYVILKYFLGSVHSVVFLVSELFSLKCLRNTRALGVGFRLGNPSIGLLNSGLDFREAFWWFCLWCEFVQFLLYCYLIEFGFYYVE